MNVFLLDEDLGLSAKYMADCHLNKQVLECCQLLNNSLFEYGIKLPKKDGGYYGYSHEQHPLSLWAKISATNKWILLHVAVYCLKEIESRFGKNLRNSYPIDAAIEAVKCIPDSNAYQTYPCYVPSEIRVAVCGKEYENVKNVPALSDAVKCYRLYYVLCKAHSIKNWGWTNGEPMWYTEMVNKLSPELRPGALSPF